METRARAEYSVSKIKSKWRKGITRTFVGFFPSLVFPAAIRRKYIYLGPDVIVLDLYLERLLLYALAAAYKALRLSAQYAHCRNIELHLPPLHLNFLNST